MIKHYLSFEGALGTKIRKNFKALFSNIDDFQVETIDPLSLYDQSPLFNTLPKGLHKITLSTSSHDVLRMISHAMHLTENKYTVSYIGESNTNDSQFSYFIENTKKNTVLTNSLGEQIHLLPANSETSLSYRLGNIRKNISTSRLYLTDSDFVFFNVNAIKYSDAPGQLGDNPSGLTSEEANQLVYMAGQSHKNKYLVLYGFNKQNLDKVTVNCILQLLWYYHYGAKAKGQPWPIPDKRIQDFTIASPMSTNDLIFRKDTHTNNWFHKIPFDLSSSLSNHQWIGSSHEEYLAVANEDLPQRLLGWYELITPE